MEPVEPCGSCGFGEATRTLLNDIDLIVYDMAGTTVQEQNWLSNIQHFAAHFDMLLLCPGGWHCLQDPPISDASNAYGPGQGSVSCFFLSSEVRMASRCQMKRCDLVKTCTFQ